jgi:hypothetical protein
MPSYYVSKKNRCAGQGCNGSNSVGSIQKVTSVESSTQAQFVTSKTVYTFYKNLTPQEIEEKGQGNLMKKGSGGNSYADYLARKKGGLSQYCSC